jgi:hypothetical protein
MSFKSIATILVVLTLIGLLTWVMFEYAVTSIRLALADEQMLTFEDMVSRASSALSGSPPNVTKAVQCLQEAHDYYPSGTKQHAGTRLDRMVERYRRSCEIRIIDLLRRATAKDYGADAEKWIKEYLPQQEGQRERVH